MVPPRLVRRVLLAPLAAVIVLFPPLALLALLLGLLGRSRPHRMRALRLLCFALIWLVAETATLFMCLGLWLASGFGGRLGTEPYQARHYAIMDWYLGRLYRAAERTLGLRVRWTSPRSPRPSRPPGWPGRSSCSAGHAGPGDSLLLVHHLLRVYRRRPRVVMKASLQLDPSLDVVANRVPNVFIQGRRTGEHIFIEQISRLARGLGHGGALVIFPEGGNWTPGRWRRGIRRLERQGRGDLAGPGPGHAQPAPAAYRGTLAAIAACPESDVIFVAHAGLDRLVSVSDVWRSLPIEQVVHASWWRVPAPDVPRSAGYEAQVRWLYDWWQRIDGWITDNSHATDPAPLA